MRDCQDVNLVVCDQIGKVVRIARHRRSPNIESLRQSLDSCSGCGPRRDRLNRRVDRVEEHGAKTSTPILIPARGVGKLRRSFRPEPDRPRHSFR